jgi:hypothetical protein
MIVTGVGMPSVQMKEFPGGNYYAHIEEPSALAPPASVTVTNLTSVPVASKTAQLVDQLNATATYSNATGALSVAASSSDLSGVTLTVLGLGGGVMVPGATAGTFTYAGVLPAGSEAPRFVDVESNAGGVFQAGVQVVAGAPMNVAGLPIANNDAPIVAGSGSTLIPVLANDTFAGAATIFVLTQPTTGTAVAGAAGVTYTATPGASGADSFTYVIKDAVGLSNVATVSFNVTFVAPGPTANADSFAMVQNSSRTYAVLANDVAGTGTTINAASVRISTPPAHGTARANLDGTITYTPAIGFNSALDTFAYTVANTAGVASLPATVTVDVFGGAEAVSFSKINYTVSKAKWTIVGSTNWFNVALTQTTATCWTGTAAAPTASTLIGTAPVDTTGKFQLVPTGATPTPVNPSSITCQTSNGGSKSGGVVFN